MEDRFDRFFTPKNETKDISTPAKLLEDLKVEFKKNEKEISTSAINPKINPLTIDNIILYNIISRIESSKTDAEAFKNVMEYMKNIPVESNDGKIQSFGNYLKISNEMITPTGQPLSGENLKNLQKCYSFHPIQKKLFFFLPRRKKLKQSLYNNLSFFAFRLFIF